MAAAADVARQGVRRVLWATLGLNVVVSLSKIAVGKVSRSTSMQADGYHSLIDAAHTRSDIYVTLGVVASFAGARAGVPWVDGVVALAIAAFIAVLGVRILVGSFHTLTDRAVIAPDKLSSVVLGVPGVRNCREVRTRGGPDAVYVDLIAHVDSTLTLREAHDVADWIE